ncbi:vacuolar segregation subunit 7-domain-containing protein, partial [Emericellopsis atlantica]
KHSRQSSATTSMTPSPLASREGSPSRNPRRTISATPLTSRSRKNSQQQEISPTRQMQIRASAPIRTASSRSLTSASTPSLPPSSDPPIQAPTPQKPVAPESRESPRWPVSPRLRSPPPLNKAAGAAGRRNEQDAPPAINVQGASPSLKPAHSAPEPLLTTSGSDTEDSARTSGTRTPARSALETVQEVSLPNSPSPSSDAALMARVDERLGSQPDGAPNNLPTLQAKARVVDSETETASDTNSSTPKADRRTNSGPPPMVQRQSSALSSKQFKVKPDNSSQNMTVETETVTSIPQVALASGPKSSEGHALKAKPSTETIKPKKEKKKPNRKQINVSSGNASSKADVFEAKIASAVDEANTSDSEETFVYDSNPPDASERTARRFHSRTPSATSMASQADRQHFRSIHGVMEGTSAPPAHGPKKGMKFVNTLAAPGSENLNAEDDGKGTGRSAGGSGRGTVRHHHHIGRWGRQPGNGHASLFDNESPFPNAAKSKLAGQQSRNSSGPPSPRGYLANGLSHKRSNYQLSNYDADEATTGADDERTPLMGPGSARRPGNGRRRGPHSLRQAEAQSFDRRPSYLNRFAACLVLTMMLLLVITGAIGFMFATSQPMTDIEILSINNVVTSEQVLMFDLTVKAHNPNIVVVTVDQANLEIFAKSEHAGTDSDWWKVPQNSDDFHVLDDPINDLPDDDAVRPNVLLGRITEFDSPLTFEGSLFHKGTSSSSGEMQLPYPGNGTSGGSERWERIYQDEFDLIVKGVVKYSLPLSTRVRSATVSGRTHVTPNSANDPSLRPNAT